MYNVSIKTNYTWENIPQIPKKPNKEVFYWQRIYTVDRWIELATLNWRRNKEEYCASRIINHHCIWTTVIKSRSRIGIACVPLLLPRQWRQNIVTWSRSAERLWSMTWRAFPKTRLLIFDTSIFEMSKCLRLCCSSVPNYSFRRHSFCSKTHTFWYEIS